MKWISVKDRLPEENEPTKFLLLRSDGEVSVNLWIQTSLDMKTGVYTKERLFEHPCPVCDGSGSLDEVTHWMPLPKMPDKNAHFELCVPRFKDNWYAPDELLGYRCADNCPLKPNT
jgi:Protein of unknown function (DUF551)